jgi:hypothetical protein
MQSTCGAERCVLRHQGRRQHYRLNGAPEKSAFIQADPGSCRAALELVQWLGVLREIAEQAAHDVGCCGVCLVEDLHVAGRRGEVTVA